MHLTYNAKHGFKPYQKLKYFYYEKPLALGYINMVAPFPSLRTELYRFSLIQCQNIYLYIYIYNIVIVHEPARQPTIYQIQYICANTEGGMVTHGYDLLIFHVQLARCNTNSM